MPSPYKAKKPVSAKESLTALQATYSLVMFGIVCTAGVLFGVIKSPFSTGRTKKECQDLLVIILALIVLLSLFAKTVFAPTPKAPFKEKPEGKLQGLLTHLKGAFFKNPETPAVDTLSSQSSTLSALVTVSSGSSASSFGNASFTPDKAYGLLDDNTSDVPVVHSKKGRTGAKHFLEPDEKRIATMFQAKADEPVSWSLIQEGKQLTKEDLSALGIVESVFSGNKKMYSLWRVPESTNGNVHSYFEEWECGNIKVNPLVSWDEVSEIRRIGREIRILGINVAAGGEPPLLVWVSETNHKHLDAAAKRISKAAVIDALQHEQQKKVFK